MKRKTYRRPSHVKTKNTGSSYKEQIENQALARKNMAGDTSQTGRPINEVVNNPHYGKQVKSPTSIGQGLINLPEGAPEADVIKITINSTGKSKDEVIVIGIDDIYKIKGDTKFKGNPDNMVYSGTLTSNKHPLWLADLRVNTYIFHMMQISVSPTSYKDADGKDVAATESQAQSQLYEEWSYINGDVQGRYGTQQMDIRDARNPFQEDRHIVYYNLKEGENRLDSLSAFVIPKFRPGMEMEIRLYVTAVVNGRL